MNRLQNSLSGPRCLRFSPTAAVVALGVSTGLLCSPSAAADKLQYNRDIRPILAENCFACHGPDSAARKAGLRIDQRAAAIEGGALEPGEPDQSTLWERVLTSDPEKVMPPPIDQEIADCRAERHAAAVDCRGGRVRKALVLSDPRPSGAARRQAATASLRRSA